QEDLIAFHARLARLIHEHGAVERPVGLRVLATERELAQIGEVDLAGHREGRFIGAALPVLRDVGRSACGERRHEQEQEHERTMDHDCSPLHGMHQMRASTPRWNTFVLLLAGLSITGPAAAQTCPDPATLTRGMDGAMAHVRYLAD